MPLKNGICLHDLVPRKRERGTVALKIEDAHDSHATKRFQNAIDLRARS
jgi:hypothetical protein